MTDIAAELPLAPPTVETISFDSEIAPIPEDWTMLIHGTDKGRGFMDQEVVTVEDQGTIGLSCITRETAVSELSRGIDTNGGYAGVDDAAEIRILFPKAANGGYGRFPDDALGLNSEEAKLRRQTYRGNSERIPNGTVLIKLGEGQGNKGRDAHYYIPVTLAERYVQTVTQETGQPPFAVVEALERYRLQQNEHNLGGVALSTETEPPVVNPPQESGIENNFDAYLIKPKARTNAENTTTQAIALVAGSLGLPVESLQDYVSALTDQELAELTRLTSSPLLRENPNANSLLGATTREARSNIAKGYSDWLQSQSGSVE